MVDKDRLVGEYVKALDANAAAVFVGAGLSRRAGYPDWRQLLESVAAELDISLEHETDLIGVAQWFINSSSTGGSERARIAQLVKDNFPPRPEVPPPHRILSRLPVKTIWTTNYDNLIERAWVLVNKHLDVKSQVDDLALRDRNAESVLYKMHGTIEHPTDIVIATDDYELYRRNRAAFLPLLQADLISRTFLFVGVSFTDPNLKFLLGLIREQMPTAHTQHFALVRRPNPADDADERLLAFHAARHRHWVSDLQRYGIQCMEMDDHTGVDDVLSAVEKRIARRSIFISGSWPQEETSTPDGQRIHALAQNIGARIVEANLRLVSGFGLTVGSAATAGALEQLYRSSTPNLERSLLLRPFPQNLPPDIDRETFQTRYREDVIAEAGIAIFLAGKKKRR